MWNRLKTLIFKELMAILRDAQTRVIIVMPVLVQVLIFPFAATLEVTNAKIAVYSEDNGPASVELVQRLSLASAFSQVRILHSPQEIRKVVDEQEVLLLVRFPADFSRKIMSGSTLEGNSAALQIILDGRHSNSAQIAALYIQEIVYEYQMEILRARLDSAQATMDSGQIVSMQDKLRDGLLGTRLEIRNWYNVNLDYKWFVLPTLIGLITTIGVLFLTALSVAREREQGTLDQLLVTPLVTWQIFVGKAVPAVIIAVFQGTIILLASIFCYQIPFSGSIALFYFCMLVYGLSLVGFGLFISSLCSTQQQAFIGVFLFMVPAMLLSGYLSPVENMPPWLQNVSMIDPIRHFTEIIKQLYLKDATFSIIWPSFRNLLIIIATTGGLAYALFRRKIS